MAKKKDIDHDWAKAKSKLEIGTVIKGDVFAHLPFGVFVNIKGPFLGLIEIPYFKELGERMTPKEYPELGEKIRAVVLGFRDSNHQIALSARPSDLKAASKPANKQEKKAVRSTKAVA